MGLDAHVHCNCIKEGKANPHPFPEMLRFDECGMAYLDESCNPTLEQYQIADSWYWKSCEHGGDFARERIGNMSYVDLIRAFILDCGSDQYPITWNQVVYNGTHGGDFIHIKDVPKLKEEIEKLMDEQPDEYVIDFISKMNKLCAASLVTGNHLCF